MVEKMYRIILENKETKQRFSVFYSGRDITEALDKLFLVSESMLYDVFDFAPIEFDNFRFYPE